MEDNQAAVFDSKELLGLVVEKISSQALLFGIAIVILLIAAVSTLGGDNILVVISILFVFLVTIGAYLFFEQRQKAEHGDPKTMNMLLDQRLSHIQNNNTDFDIQVWTAEKTADTHARDIGVAPKQKQSNYQIGDKVVILFRANKDCYLTLLNIGTSGKLTLLFPNALHQENFIRANQIYRIPDADYGFEYQLQGPAGTEMLKAIATENKIELVESNFTSGGVLFETRTPQVAARDINIIKTKIESETSQSWAESGCRFSVSQA
jgi:hypothetical protein